MDMIDCKHTASRYREGELPASLRLLPSNNFNPLTNLVEDAGRLYGPLDQRVKALRRISQLADKPLVLHLLQGGLCFFCHEAISTAPYKESRPRGFTIDHLIPQSFGGGFVGNAVLACNPCNALKASSAPTDLELAACRQLWRMMAIVNPSWAAHGSRPSRKPN